MAPAVLPVVSLAVALAVVAGLLSSAPPAAAALTYGVAASTVQVRPTDTAAGLPTSATLTAARNETESFQIVVPGPVTISSVTAKQVSWATVGIYAARAYTVTEPSDLEGATGDWYDALVPTRDQMYNEARNAFPVTVPARRNALVWVDVVVKATAPAATYRDLTVTLTTSAGVVAVPVTTTVLGVTLPSTSTFRTLFISTIDGSGDKLCAAHFNGDSTCGNNPAQRLMLYSLYSRLALENRVSIANGNGLRYDQSPAAYPAADWESYIEGPLLRGKGVVPASATWRLAGAKLTAVSQFAYTDFHCGVACANQWKAEATEAGQSFASSFIWYACDEANNSNAAWTACATANNPVNAAWPRPRLVTGTIRQYDMYRTTSGFGEAQILVPPINRLWDKPNTAEAGDQRATYAAYLAAPSHSLWAYSSCMSAGCEGDTFGSPGQYWKGWPGYAIDGPANAARALPWMAITFNLKGEANWGYQQDLTTAWNAGGLFEKGMNGDGTLVYPGTPARIGGTTNIPLESMRLKRLRDGQEDHALMTWLIGQGKSTEVKAIVAGVYPTAYAADITRDGSGAGSLAAGRAQLNALVGTVIASRRIAFSSTRAGGSGYDIWTVAPDGIGATRLTTTAGDERFPAWSPKATKIAFNDATDVWVMNANGSGKVNLTTDLAAAASKPAWVSGSALIAFVVKTAAGSDVWLMNPDGTNKRLWRSDAYDPTAQASTYILYSRAGDLRRGAVASDADVAVVTGPSVDEVADAGETTMTYSTSSDGAKPYDIFIRSLTSTSGRNMTSSFGATVNDLHSSLSPDETRVVYTSRATATSDLELWIINRTDLVRTQLSPSAAQDTDPDWAPL